MDIFLVAPTKFGDVIRRKAVEMVKEENIKDIGNGCFFIAVAEPMPIDQIKTEIGLTGKDGGGFGVIVKVANYGGYADRSIGDWLEVKDV